MKQKLSELYKICDKADIVLFKRGDQWVASYPIGSTRAEEPLHYSIKTKREALELFVKRLKFKNQRV